MMSNKLLKYLASDISSGHIKDEGALNIALIHSDEHPCTPVALFTSPVTLWLVSRVEG